MRLLLRSGSKPFCIHDRGSKRSIIGYAVIGNSTDLGPAGGPVKVVRWVAFSCVKEERSASKFSSAGLEFQEEGACDSTSLPIGIDENFGDFGAMSTVFLACEMKLGGANDLFDRADVPVDWCRSGSLGHCHNEYHPRSRHSVPICLRAILR